MKQIHLLCNAHLDPVWLWQWEEGVTEAISTFRTACDLLDEFDELQFNHNESVLYEWVKEYDPVTFERIKAHVAAGRWHILGGWFIQPDCNMPAGESLVRNIQHGRRFFKREFGKEPTTAINFDSFGHSKGMVQVLRQAGYDSYVVYRAGKAHSIPESDFTWKGLGDAEILVHRSDKGYNSVLGKVAPELEEYLKKYEKEPVTLFLWGVGDHGGGPSRKDLNDLRELFRAHPEYEFIHSNPETYVAKLRELKVPLPEWTKGLNPVADGCYTSQIRIKQRHRKLENELYSAEKIAVIAELLTGATYPAESFRQAEYDLLFSEFHDILPGSDIKDAEDDALRLMDHGLELMAREKLRAAMALSAGQEQVHEGCSTMMVANPHPFDYEGLFELETSMPAQNWDDIFYYPQCSVNGEPVPTQYEFERNRFAIDWRKKAVVRVKLPASSLSRVDMSFLPTPKRPEYEPLIPTEGFEWNRDWVFDNGRMRVQLNLSTGLIDSLRVDGKEILGENSMQLVAYEDSFSPWGLDPRGRGRRPFRLMTDTEAADFCVLRKPGKPIHIIEDGPIRTVVEAMFTMHGSNAYLRYKLPKEGTEFEIESGVYWNEKEKVLKLEMISRIDDPAFLGQVPFGLDSLDKGEEVVSQKWQALVGADRALSVMGDGGYGSSLRGNTLALTVLRSAAHSAAHCQKLRTLEEERFVPRMDQGERIFHWAFNAGSPEILDGIANRALAWNEKPYAFSYNPSGYGEKPGALYTIDNPAVVVSALKKRESGEGYILRLYESEGKAQQAQISIPKFNIRKNIELKPFELRTLRLDPKAGTLETAELIDMD